MPQPSPQPLPTAEARQVASALQADYGEAAIGGAKVALKLVADSGDADAIGFWTEVCAILATDRTVSL